jgi:monovalent cation:proton antiporter-2 (CPA2) family protein
MNGQSLLTQALVYLAAGVGSVPIAKRLGLGSVLGYLVAGAVIGPFALSLVGPQADVMRFAEFGVVILLFLIGLEVRPALLWSLRGTIFGLGGAQVGVSAAVVGGAAMLLGLDWKSALAVGFAMAMSSTAIVLQTLEEKGLRQGPVGQTAFGVLLMQDLMVIPLFALLPLLAPGGAMAPAGQNTMLAGQPAWLQAIAGLAAVALVVGGGRYLVRPAFRFIAAARLREIFTASALLLVIAVAVLMELVGLSPALGAFLAGVVLAESEFRRELETDIEPFRGLLLGLFFITVGANLDFGLVVSHPVELAGAVLGIMALKGVVMFLLGRAAGLQRREAAATAVALTQVGEFAFVLLGLIHGSGIITGGAQDFLIAAVALSMALTPLAMAGYDRACALVEARDRRNQPAPDTGPFDEGAPDVIVAGFGRFGQVAGRLLTANGFRTVVLDSSIEHIELLRRFGRPVHYGDATRLDLLRQAGADKAKVLLVAIDGQDQTSQLVETAREAFPQLKILARAWDRRHAYDLLRNGADEVERETFEGSLAIGVKALRALGFRAHRAHRAANLFRVHDLRAFNKLAPLTGGEEGYILAARDAQSTMDRLLKADMDSLRPDAVDEAWDTAARDEEQREDAWDAKP